MGITQQTKEDILFMYQEGYSRKEIYDEYEGISTRIIDDICDEEDHSWDAE